VANLHPPIAPERPRIMVCIAELTEKHEAAHPGILEAHLLPWLLRTPQLLSAEQCTMLAELHPVIVVERPSGGYRVIAGHRTIMVVHSANPEAMVPVVLFEGSASDIAKLAYMDLVLTPLVYALRTGAEAARALLGISLRHLDGVRGTDWDEALAPVTTPEITTKRGMARLTGIRRDQL